MAQSITRKRCSYCKRQRLVKFFHKSNTRRDGLQNYCVDCRREQHREFVSRDREHWNRRCATRDNTHREYVARIKEENPCTDCGNYFPACVMDFDHTKGDKRYNVGDMMNLGLKRIQEEIDKCDLVCANCHRIRTHRNTKCPV